MIKLRLINRFIYVCQTFFKSLVPLFFHWIFFIFNEDRFKGGVLGFWGGVLLLGAVFMVALMAQKYCCDTGQRKDDID